MKRLLPGFIRAVIVPVLFVAAGCGSSAPEPGDRELLPVTEATSESGPGRVILRWKIPEDHLYYYTKIEYLNPLTGKLNWAYADKFAADGQGYTTATIGGFVEEAEHDFHLTAHGFYSGMSRPVTVTGRSLPSVHGIVAATLELEPDLLGGILRWENDFDTGVVIRAYFTGLDGEETFRETYSQAAGTMRLGNMGPGAQQVRVYVYDESGEMASDAVSFPDFTPLAATIGQFDRSLWTVAECKDEWIDNQPAGLWVASNLLDGNLSTTWHTNAGDPSSNYPFWVTFDMGGDNILTTVEIYARQSTTDLWGPEQIRIELSDDGSVWEDAGTFPFDRLNMYGQRFDLDQSIFSARYLKVVLVQGVQNHSYLAEIYAYGVSR